MDKVRDSSLNGIPLDWEIKKLNEIGVIYSGSTPSTTVSEFWNGEIVWITPNDLSRLRTPYISTSERKITSKGLNSSSTNLLPAYSIVISSRAPIGYVAISQIECCTNQGCKSIVLHQDYDPEFCYYNLNFHIDKLKNLGEGTTFSEISKTALSDIQLPFPKNKNEQTQIATILSKIDQAIEQTEQIIVKYQRIKTGLMQDLLTRGIDEHGNIRSEETHEFKGSPLGRIPKEWEVSELNEVAYIVMGQSPVGSSYNNNGQGIPLINGPVEFGKRYPIKRQWTISPTKICEPFDILFCVRGSTTGRMNISNDTYCIGRGVAAIRGKRDVTVTGYIELILKQLAYQILSEAKGSGSTFPSITSLRLAKTLLKKPPIEEQKNIVKILSKVEVNINIEENKLSKLYLIKTGLMQDLLTGKVRVQ